MRFAIVTDIHIGEERPYEGLIRKLSRFSLSSLEKIVNRINSELDCAFMVQLGDLIEDGKDAEEDLANYMKGIAAFAACKIPVLHLLGNHEQVNLDYEQVCRAAGLKNLHYSCEIEGYKQICLFSHSKDHTDIYVDEQQLRWLEQQLTDAQKPCLIFIHHPIDEQDLKGSFWFEKYPDYCFVQQRNRIRKLLEDSGKVIAVFNGHVHRNYFSTINGIHYFSLQSLVERMPGLNQPGETHAFIEVNPDQIVVDIHGFDRHLFKAEITGLRAIYT